MAFTNDAPDDQGPPQPDKQPYFRQLNPPPDNSVLLPDPAHTTARGYPFDPGTGLEWRGGRWRPPNPDEPPDYSRTTVDGRPLVPPQPQPKPEPYIPSRTDRPYSQWGDPDFALAGARKYPGLSPGPFMPQVNDFPGLIHAAVMGLGRFGSRYTGMPAIAMGTYATAYWNAYSQGLKERAAQSYQQYRQARQMTIDRGKDEMTAFRQVYAAYHDDKGNVTDPTAFSQSLLATAKRFQNHSVINAVENGQIAMAERILQATDGQLNNLVKAQHQEERQRKLDEEKRRDDEERRRLDKLREEVLRRQLQKPQDPWGLDSGAEPPAPDTATTEPPAPDTATTEPPAPDTADDAGGGTPDDTGEIQTADAGGTQPSTTGAGPSTTGAGPSTTGAGPAPAKPAPSPPSSDVPPGADPNPYVRAAANDVLRGLKPEFVPQNAQGRVSKEVERQKSLFDQIANSGMPPEQALAGMKKINPLIGREIESMGNYDRPVPSGGLGQSGIYANLEPYVKAAFPTYNAAYYKVFDDVRRGASPESKVMSAAARMQATQKAVFEALKNIPENERPPAAWLQSVIAGYITGTDTRWNALGTALLDNINEVAAVSRGSAGGTLTEGDRRRLLEAMGGLPRTPKMVRQFMKTSSIMAYGNIETTDAIFSAKVERPDMHIPGYPKQATDWLGAVAHINPATGNMEPGYTAPNDLKPYLGPAGTGAGGGGASDAKEGDRKQFKQGWGVFRNGKWVPEQ
jgi:hypothetical protein